MASLGPNLRAAGEDSHVVTHRGYMATRRCAMRAVTLRVRHNAADVDGFAVGLACGLARTTGFERDARGAALLKPPRGSARRTRPERDTRRS
jgi:hypothetical protein